MTPAQLQYLHDVARQLDAAPAGGGERGQIVARAAQAIGKSPKTLYGLLRKHVGWQSGRKPRADAGRSCVDRDLALAVGGIVHLARRQNGKRTRTIKGARETLAANGYGVKNDDTGEVVMPSAATLSRAMRQHCCHPEQLSGAAPATSLRSLHPNHTWQVDASVCVLYRMRGSNAVRLLNERDYNEHKPGKLVEISGQRILRYLVIDHYSGNIYLHYEQAKGEDALGVIKALIGTIDDRGARDPMHGAPLQAYMDPGSGNKSSLLLNFVKQLDIEPLHHAAGNARATGGVEVGQNIVETQFEGRLRFMAVPSVADLQAKADAWRAHYNATQILRRAGKTRNALWATITSAQLRTVSREVMEAIAAWGDVRRKVDGHFKISVDTRAFGVREYDLRELGYHGLCVGETVLVRLNPFLAPVIRVIKMQADGTELMFEVSPAEAIIDTVQRGARCAGSPEMRGRMLHQMLISSSRGGNRHVLVIEEAHDLHVQTIKSLKRFWELKDGMRRLLSIILIGQTELRGKLSNTQAEVREVVQRCDVIDLPPIKDPEAYLTFRFKVAGADINNIFEPEALAQLREQLVVASSLNSNGVYLGYPLAIANLARAAMSKAYEIGESIVTGDVMRLVQPKEVGRV